MHAYSISQYVVNRTRLSSEKFHFSSVHQQFVQTFIPWWHARPLATVHEYTCKFDYLQTKPLSIIMKICTHTLFVSSLQHLLTSQFIVCTLLALLLVPSLSAFSRYSLETGENYLNNNMLALQTCTAMWKGKIHHSIVTCSF